MRQLTQHRAQFSMRRPTASEFGGHACREDLVLLEFGIVIRHEGIIGVVRRGTSGESGAKLARYRDPICPCGVH